MATSNFQTQKSFSVLLSISLTLFLLLLSKVNSTETTSFTCNKFVPHQKDLILQGDALITSKGKLQLTKVEGGKPIYYSLGRALYSAPVHIWDSTTGNLASFITTFSFVISAVDKNKTADGIAFFLGPIDTQPQKPGGFLGLFNDKYYSKSNQIVAVEFDTYYNAEFDDPQTPHIGIDVNSIKSIKTTLWGFANGQVATVVISYQASSKTLTASLVHPSHQTSHIVSSVVDLKNVLPQYVRVGLSGASGLSKDYVETHEVLSWSFDSKLPDCNVHALEINNTHLSSHVLHDSV